MYYYFALNKNKKHGNQCSLKCITNSIYEDEKVGNQALHKFYYLGGI